MLIGEIAAITTAIFWSFGTVFFTFGINKVGVLQLSIDRLGLASIYLLVTMFIFGISYQITSYQFIFFVLSAFVGLVLGDTFLFKAFSEVGPRISLLIMSFAPPVAAVLAYFVLGETLGNFAIIGIIVTTFGISLVIFEKDESTNKFTLNNKMGILWATLGMLGQAGGLILAKIALKETDVSPFVASLTRILSAWIMLIPIGYITKRYKFGFSVYKPHKNAIYAPTIGAILGPYLGITLSMVAINYAKIGIASTLMATTPIMMLPISHFILKEKLVWQSIVGAFIAVLGIGLLFIK
jgi:drug/metabolite transporter (DMT)-like permease